MSRIVGVRLLSSCLSSAIFSLMNRKRKLSLLVLFIILLIAGGYFLFREKHVEVTVFKVAKGDVEATVTATTTGTVKARAISKISSQYPGRIERILKREGTRVKKGEILMELDGSDAKTQLSQAEASLKAANAELSHLIISRDVVVSQSSAMVSQTKAKLDNAKASLERAHSLYPKGMQSKQELDNARSAFDVAKADYESAMANELQGKMKDEEIRTATAKVDQMKSSLEQAKIQLSRTHIAAPYSGIVTDLFVEEGELLGLGTPVCQLADESTLYVEAIIDEVDAGKLLLGQDVKLTFDAFKDKRFTGKITEISPLVTTTKEQNRTVEIKVEINTTQDGIKIGMSTDVEVITGKVKNVPYIPTNAIIEKIEGQFVFVAEKEITRERRIKTGLSNWDTTEIVEGVKEGDEVITSLEIKTLKDRTKVKVKND